LALLHQSLGPLAKKNHGNPLYKHGFVAALQQIASKDAWPPKATPVRPVSSQNQSLYWSLFLMETIFADMTVSMSEFKKNPASVLRQAHNRPVAVLNHNKAAFYMVEPRLFQALLGELAEQELRHTATPRTAVPPHDVGTVWRAAIVRLSEKAAAMTPLPASPQDH
jgi:antitoxin StbD